MTDTAVSPFAKALSEASGAREAFKVAIIAPVHKQPSEAWIQALNVASRTATIIIISDAEAWGNVLTLPENWDVYDYDRQKGVMGDELYTQFQSFQKSSACKQFGVWLAYERGFDPIIVIDSDCIIPPDFVAKHIEALLQSGDGWDNPIKGSGFYSRGFPYYERKKPIWAHMGLWENELDLYGTDRVGVGFVPKIAPHVAQASTGALFPLSGMNVSFRNDAAPYMLFLPNFEYQGQKFSRHDDIWGGYIFQRVAHSLGFALSYGDPLVFHDTVVVPEEDAAEEVPMIKYERDFYRMVDDALNLTLWWGQTQPTPSDVFTDMADYLKRTPGSAFEGLIPAFRLAADMLRAK